MSEQDEASRGHRDRGHRLGGTMEQVAVIGAGSWGSALAVHLALVGHEVKLWGRDGSLVEEMAARRANPVYLPDVTFPPGLSPTAGSEGRARRPRRSWWSPFLHMASAPSHARSRRC